MMSPVSRRTGLVTLPSASIGAVEGTRMELFDSLCYLSSTMEKPQHNTTFLPRSTEQSTI